MMNITLEEHRFLASINCSIYENFTNLSPYHEFGCHGLEEPGPSPGQPWWVNMILQILYGIVCCVGLCGNTLVIYVVVRFSKMQTVTNLYIVNLAIADECFLVGIPFLMTTIGLEYWPFGNIVCKAYFTSTSINQITSSMFLLIMSADRYLAVCHPISAPKWRTPLIAKFVALTAWTLSALIMVPIYMYANTLEIDNKINCNIFWPSSETWTGESIFIVYSFIISFAVPLTLIMIFYVLVILKLKTVGPKRRPPQPSTPQIAISGDRKLSSGGPSTDPPMANHLTPQQASRARDRKRSHRKVTKLVLTVITVYFLCWAPYWATQMALIFMPHDSNHSQAMLSLFLLAGCLSYSNSTMNPILYAFLSDNFKKSFLKACTCAKGSDVNAQLHVENSVFPRGKKSEKARKGVPTSGTSGALTGTQGNNTGSGSGIIPSGSLGTNSNSKNILLQVPTSQVGFSVPRIPVDDDDLESGESEDDEGVAILGGGSSSGCGGFSSVSGASGSGLQSSSMQGHTTPSTSTTTTGGLMNSAEQQNTFIQDGVHVTSL